MPEDTVAHTPHLQETLNGYTIRNSLAEQVNFEIDHFNNEIHGTLRGFHCRQSIHPHVTTEEARQIREHITEHLVHVYMEQLNMPEFVNYTTNTNTDNIDTARWTTASGLGPLEVESSVENIEQPTSITPIFTLQQNRQDIELRALRDSYPHELHNFDYQAPIYRALDSYVNDIRNIISRVRRMQALKIMLESLPLKHREVGKHFIFQQMSSGEQRFIISGNNIEDYSTYRDAVRYINDYREARATFRENRERFSPMQAEYNQRVAMIRQKPRIYTTINGQELIEDLSQWNNIWGVAIGHDEVEELLYIRIGLSDIVMEESATDSRYDYAAKIALAPFFFTIRLTTYGRFVCASNEGNALGLSREYAPGTTYFDFHPHQLSDSPCFGSFGQTMIDAAGQGDIKALISLIASFYSQYNSEDSAGVSARDYHPANLSIPNNTDSYLTRMIEGITTFAGFHVIDEEKLKTAMDNYMVYYADERTKEPPNRLDTYYCASCEEVNVSDGYDFYTSYHDERICPGCWDDHYCESCERYVEDCTCN